MESPRVAVRSEADDVWVVVCTGEFDLDTTGELAVACDRVTADAQLLVIDVSGVAFADSSFLNVLIRLRNSRPLVLAGPLPSQLHRLLEMTGALALFALRDNTTSAS
ncbi:STAS domain-containing protein [Streptomyces virginiae]|uniref:STAS domain-containing protein n=1 Tax=Streptomyces virginiae TaxID=1961 RepID=UPI0022505AFC|nr:STAS domain-containing protein [Streptomyces virginiae]MCX4960971.1 STAS domain-containing protein [Streptomyces virginiae]MCX5181070.1 STAS domain-containing protein [Streptomyces virginiae]